MKANFTDKTPYNQVHQSDTNLLQHYGYLNTNGIRLHCVDHGGTGEVLILLHGLTANAHFFDGLVHAGLTEHLHVIAVDLRGRGLSDKANSDYSMETHAQDNSNSFWGADLEAYYRADVETLPDGSVRSYARPNAMIEAVKGGLHADWEYLMPLAKQPAILLHAPEGFRSPGAPPLMTHEGAQATVQALGNCRYVPHAGHHYTMAFGKNASAAVTAIAEFVRES